MTSRLGNENRIRRISVDMTTQDSLIRGISRRLEDFDADKSHKYEDVTFVLTT